MWTSLAVDGLARQDATMPANCDAPLPSRQGLAQGKPWHDGGEVARAGWRLSNGAGRLPSAYGASCERESIRGTRRAVVLISRKWNLTIQIIRLFSHRHSPHFPIQPDGAPWWSRRFPG